MFPAGAHLKRVNLKPIRAAEADAIEAAIRESRDDFEAIAARFGRTETTIRKIGEKRGILARRCSSSTSTGASGSPSRCRTEFTENRGLSPFSNNSPQGCTLACPRSEGA